VKYHINELAIPAKDIYHDAVKQALIKDGWLIVAENYIAIANDL
jgi:XisH protein